MSIAGLNCNGNPLHPDPEVGPEDAEDLRNAIRVAGLLGVDRVVTMSGLPQAHPGGKWPAWHVNTWDSGYLDSLDYQWDEVAVPFWTEIDALAREHGVKVAIEMHPQNLVFNPPTLKRLVEKTGATHVGAEMDPSHLFWQGIDPVDAIEWLGPLVSTPPRRTRASMTIARSTGFLTTASREFRSTRTRPASADGTS